MLEWARGRSRGWWLTWAVLALLVGVGVWAFTSEMPNHDMEVQVAHRSAGDGLLEVALRSTDHIGEQRWHVPPDSLFDPAQLEERYRYSQPIALPGFGPLARVSTLNDGPDDLTLGFRVNRPNGSWSYTRFPSREPIALSDQAGEEWLLSRPLTVRVNVNQPLLAGVRLAYYLLMGAVFVIAVTLYIWRRWLN